jgi:4-alpha-glucanotransferase
MPPFAAFWQSLDLADHLELGLIQRGDLDGASRLRGRIRRSLLRLLRRQGMPGRGPADARAVLPSVLRHLGASAARWVLVNLEDLWLETAPQNTPGTSTERVNWRRKTRFALEQLCEERAGWGFLGELRHPRK